MELIHRWLMGQRDRPFQCVLQRIIGTTGIVGDGLGFGFAPDEKLMAVQLQE